MSQNCSLNELNPGETAVVKELKTRGSIRRRLLDIGLVKDTKIECVGKSPAGDPAAFLIRGAVIAIRSEDMKDIVVRIITSRN